MSPLVQHPGMWLRMPSLPPGWDGLHPWVVHCPLALFLTAPVFVFLAMILFQRGRWMSLTALVLLGSGLIGAWLSQSSGLAARDYLNQSSVTLSDEAAQVLQQHQQLGSTIVPLYGILFVVYLVLFLLSIAVRPFDNPVWIFFMNLIFLILLLVAGLVLVNTGELGGRLVHEFGVHGRIRPTLPGAEKPPAPEEKTTPPKQKPTPPETVEKPEKPLPPEKPEEKPAPQKPTPPTEKPKEKAAQEKPISPSEEKPSVKSEEKPSSEKTPPPVKEKPHVKPEEKPSEKPSAPAQEKSSEKESAPSAKETPSKKESPATVEEKPSQKESASSAEEKSSKP